MDSLRVKQEPSHESYTTMSAPRARLRTDRSLRRIRRQRGVNAGATPTELLEKIGLMGKDVVKILKDCGWEVCDPKGLQHHKRYYALGGRAKGEQAVHKRDFFVGEGELYAHVLDQGGINAFKPGVVSPSMTPSSCSLSPPSLSAEIDSSSCVSEESARPPISSSRDTPIPREGIVPGPQKRKKRKRKSLPSRNPSSSTRDSQSLEQRSHTSERTPSTSGGDQTYDRASTTEPRQLVTAVTPPTRFTTAFNAEMRNKMRYSRSAVVDHQRHERSNSQTSTRDDTKTRTYDWRLRVLRNVEVHLLRFVANVHRHRRVISAASSEQNATLMSSDCADPYAIDSAWCLQELDDLALSLDGSQRDLWVMVTDIISQDDRQNEDDEPDQAGRLRLPAFAPEGSGDLLLLGDMDRYLLRLVATVRRYRRARSTAVAKSDAAARGENTAVCTATVCDHQDELDSLQQSIDESLGDVRAITNEIVDQAREHQTLTHSL